VTSAQNDVPNCFYGVGIFEHIGNKDAECALLLDQKNYARGIIMVKLAYLIDPPVLPGATHRQEDERATP
jgi:hypothetical protein